MGWPLGTPEEVVAAGFPLRTTPCCAPQKSMHEHEGTAQEVGGCPFWIRQGPEGGISECLFKEARYGGFRGKGPRNVGVFIRLDAAEVVPGAIKPAAGTHTMPCFLFESALRDRYEQQRKTGEKIDVIAVEPGVTKALPSTMPYVEETLVADPMAVDKFKRVRKLNPAFEIPKLQRIGENDPMNDLEKMVATNALEAMQEKHEKEMEAELKEFAGDGKIAKPRS